MFVRKAFCGFSADDQGSVTIWNLFWLTGLLCLMGLALDVTAAMNAKARVQTIADAAAHAAAIDLFPLPETAVDSALTYAGLNDAARASVRSTDVAVGYWNRATRAFEAKGAPHVNAVRVIAGRDDERGNALGTSFLRLAGFHLWDIAAVSTAMIVDDLSLIHRCRTNGFVAGGETELTSNNILIGNLCLHGEAALKINSNNVITCGILLSTPDADRWKTGRPPSGIPPEECNTDYRSMSDHEMLEQAVAYGSFPSTAQLEYDNVRKILDAFISKGVVNDPFSAIPPYITGHATVDPNTFNNDSKQGELVPGTLYVVSCAGTNKKLQPQGIIRNIGIYTDCVVDVPKDKDVSDAKPARTTGTPGSEPVCDPDTSDCEEVPWEAEIAYGASCAEAVAAGFEAYETLLDTAAGETYRDGVSADEQTEPCAIEPGANGLWDNVFLFTTANADGDRSQKSVTFPNNMQLGRIDGCSEGGGVRLYSGGSIQTPSGTVIHGSQFVALGDVQMAAKASGAHGLNVAAAGDIKFSAQGQLGGCDAAEELLQSDVVITVRPIAIVQ